MTKSEAGDRSCIAIELPALTPRMPRRRLNYSDIAAKRRKNAAHGASRGTC